MRTFARVVVLGANGAMGSASGAIFAGAGLSTTFLARTREKAATGLARAQRLLRTGSIRPLVEVGSYDDLENAVAAADLIFEAVAEDYAIKRPLLSRVDSARRAGSLVATVSSGLSIAKLSEGMSTSFSQHFLGMHFFNPPTILPACELVAHSGTTTLAIQDARDLLCRVLGRQVIEARDTPAFCGNRIGFRVLNGVAQLAHEHGVHYLERLLGGHTGRTMGPFGTMDFVGLDVHQAIVENLGHNTNDEAHSCFAVPAYLRHLVAEGHLGDKTPSKGGFYRSEGKGPDARRLVLDVQRGDYRPVSEVEAELPELVRRIRQLHRTGQYTTAAQTLSSASGKDAEIMRAVVLEYISYALNRVGEVVGEVKDVDRVMAFGFNWAPPGLWVDLFSPRTTVRMLQQADLGVPNVLAQVAERNGRMFNEKNVDRGRFFMA